jgi:hypothetical protein
MFGVWDPAENRKANNIAAIAIIRIFMVDFPLRCIELIWIRSYGAQCSTISFRRPGIQIAYVLTLRAKFKQRFPGGKQLSLRAQNVNFAAFLEIRERLYPGFQRYEILRQDHK